MAWEIDFGAWDVEFEVSGLRMRVWEVEFWGLGLNPKP